MKIRSIQTCIMSSLPYCSFRCSVFKYVISVNFGSFHFSEFQLILEVPLNIYLHHSPDCSHPVFLWIVQVLEQDTFLSF